MAEAACGAGLHAEGERFHAPARTRAACPEVGPRPPGDACHLPGLSALRCDAKQRRYRSQPTVAC
jgi:hypothetical protein